jgi:hypothetical protein
MIGMSYRPLADMESNGVYFDRPEDQEIEICQYSGLPSVKSYTEPIANEVSNETNQIK